MPKIQKTAAENSARQAGIAKPQLRKLTPEICLKIEELKLPTVSVRRVAEIIGLHHTSVSRYLRGAAHIDQPNGRHRSKYAPVGGAA